MTAFFPWPAFWYLTTGEFLPSTDQKQTLFYEDPSLGPDPVQIINRGITFYVD